MLKVASVDADDTDCTNYVLLENSCYLFFGPFASMQNGQRYYFDSLIVTYSTPPAPLGEGESDSLARVSEVF